MSDTLAPCEVVNTEERGNNDGAGKCDTKDGEDTSMQNPSTDGTASITDVVLEVEEEKIGDVRKVGEDDGEASDETSSSRRESNSSMDGSEDVDVQLKDNNDQDTTNTNTPELNTQPTIKKKKKRRSRHSSRSHNRSVSRHASSPDFTTPSYPITTTTTTPIPNIPNPTIPTTLTTQQQNNQQQDTSGSGNNTINFHSPTSLSKSTSEPLPHTSEQTTTTTSTPSPSNTKPFPPIHHSFHKHTRLSTSMTASSPNLPTFDDLSHIPQHLLDLTPPPTRGRSNAFYGTKSVPPLIHSHSDGAAIVAAQNNNINNNNYNPGSPNRRNTVGLTFAVPSMPEPSHSGISKPKMFNYWRSLSGPPSYEKAVISHSKRFLVGFAETIGRRPSMEDCMVVHGAFRGRGHEDYFALFDGHGGRDAAAFAASHLHQILADKLKTNNAVKSLKEAFADTHRMISEQKIIGGTTAVVALFIGKKGFIANVGDTRAVLCRDGVPLRVSLDHKPELPAEMSRIRQLGGTVTTTYNSAGQATSRVNGMLAVSRALGDCVLHPYVSHEPEIHGPLNLDTESRDQFVVLACDGVWDVLTDEEATSIVAPIANPEIASRRLRDEAFARGSTDNISVMVIRCPPFLPCD